jgi:FKBP-type peptidyl-prolyl cis-trans isomerase 2
MRPTPLSTILRPDRFRPRHLGRRALRLLVAAVALQGVACAGDSSPVLPGTTPDAVRSTVSVDRSTGVLADGVDTARITVTVRDARGLPIRGLLVDVAASGVGNVVTQPPDVTAADGTVEATLATTVAERKVVTATVGTGAAAVVLADQPAVDFTAPSLPPVRVAFLAQPSDTTVGAVIAPAVQVAIQDAEGHTVTSATHAVTLALEGGAAGATLGGTVTVNAVAGIATFSTLTVDTVGEEYTLAATVDEGLTGAVSQAFDVLPGSAARLVFVAQPQNAVAGAVLAPPVQVEVQDLAGNPITDAVATVTLALGQNPAGDTLAGQTAVAVVDGIATFSDLSLDRAGTGYTLVATAPGLTSATSVGFAVAPAAVAHLALGGLATPTTAGATQTLTVAAEDAFGNRVTGYTGTVHLTATDSAAALPADHAFTAGDAGVHGFAGVVLRTAGPVTVTATDTVTTALTGSLQITVAAAAAAGLEFVAQPHDAVAGVQLAPAVRVSVVDAFGNLVPGTDAIAVALGQNPGAATLAGTTSVNAVGGVATFSDLSLARAGVGYTLVATRGLLTRESAAFTVTPAATAALTVVGLPDPVTAGAAQTVTVTARDAYGNVTPAYRGTLHFTSTDGAATLPGDYTFVAADAGAHGFAGVTLRTAGTRAVTATDTVTTALTGTLQVTVAAAAAAGLEFVAQPQDAVAGVALAPAVRVSIVDAFGNLVAGTDAIAVALGQNPAAATLAGTTSVNAVGGVATFSDLSLVRAATGYTLMASSGLFTRESAAFTITPAATAALTVTGLSDPFTAGDAETVTVTARDAYGNVTPAYRGTVHLTSTDGAATLPADATFTAGDAGSHGYGGLTLRTAGNRAVIATDTVAPGVTGQQALQVVPAAASHLVFLADPAATRRGTILAPAPVVEVRDPYENPATGYAGTLDLSLAAAPGPGVTLGGTLSLAVSAGRATFADLTLDRTGAGYRLQAASGALPPVTGAAFDVYEVPALGDLLVTEALVRPASSNPLQQWLEVRNLSPELLRLEGMTITDTLAGKSFTVGASRLLPAGELFLFAASSDPGQNGGIPAVDAVWPGSFQLGTSGALDFTADGDLVHHFAYDDASYPHTAGAAMSLSSAVMGAGADQHPWYWCDAATSAYGGDLGTPGLPNGDCGIVPDPGSFWCAIQWPDDVPQVGPPAVPPLVVGQAQEVYARFYEPGVTTVNLLGNDHFPFVVAQVGIGPTTDPAGWTWTDADFTPDADYHGDPGATPNFEPNNDELKGALQVAAAGSYRYGYRVGTADPETGAVATWWYCGRTGLVDNGNATSREDYGALLAEWPACLPSPVVISQVYPGGGSATGLYKYDWVELHNRSVVAQSLAGWSLQYCPATSTSWTTLALAGSIPAGGHYLIQVGSVGSGGADLPVAPDQTTGLMSMGASGGRVALVTSTTALSACPTLPDPAVADLVGYGTATCFEGAVASAPTVSQALVRAGEGCTDTDHNSTDLAPDVPNPRNSAGPTNHCSCQ